MPWVTTRRGSSCNPADLATWLEQRFPAADGIVSEGDLGRPGRTRSALARAATSASRGEAPAPLDVDIINLFAATPDIAPALEGGTTSGGSFPGAVGQALSAMAREAIGLLAAADEGVATGVRRG